ncbi:hypothetical protein K435DRAFT_959273 [Dendrothele bispora CBS 962.96]|uniref:Uncharacterized protein n=1 Tax=Dendrothele bispora (strain CBS 962.96) TaxID=1314807 RepID=A0A4S8MYG9_DENBC|nr:hypothetical protein K435DRAFT_959273 [Dendrothele bispora CBS 962.96]
MSGKIGYLNEILPTAVSPIPDSAESEASHSTLATGTDVASNFLTVSVVVFDALKDASIAAPFPFAFIAASLALEVLTAVQDTKDNKRAFRNLAKDIYEIGLAIRSTLQQVVEKGCTEEAMDAGLNDNLNDNLEALAGTLGEVLRFIRERAARSYVKRFLSSKSDIGRIQEYRQRLRHALDLFGLQSNITLRSALTKLTARQKSIHEELKELNARRNTQDQTEREKSDTLDSQTSNSEASTLVDSHIFHDSEICASPVEQPASESETGISESKQFPSQEQSPKKSLFDFSGSNIQLSGVTFNNYSGSQTEVKHFNNSSLVNSNNLYYMGPDSMSMHQIYTPNVSKNPFHPCYNSPIPISC